MVSLASPQRKIYFAASIKAGRELALDYFAIVEILKGFGSVLSEHVASPNLEQSGEALDHHFIHARDLSFILEAELVVAEVTVPSLGVGYEIRYSVEQNKKIICLCKSDKKEGLSAMISGAPNITKIFYSDIEDLQMKLLTSFSEHLDTITTQSGFSPASYTSP